MVFSSEKKSVYYSRSEGTDRQSAKPSSGSSFLLAWAAERDNTIWPSHEAAAGGAWSLRVSLLAPSSFLERRTGLAIALHPCRINAAWYMSGCCWHWDEGLKGQMQKWFGRNWQRLTYQHTNCLCPKNFKYSSSLPNKLVKAALEIFVVKLNMAGENIVNKTFWFVVGSTLPSGDIKSHLTCPLKVTEILPEQWSNGRTTWCCSGSDFWML